MGIAEEILSTLKDIKGLLEGGATGVSGSGGKGGAEKKPAGKKAKHTSEEISALMQPITKTAEGKAAIKKVFAAFGIARLGEATEDQFDGIYDAVTEIAETASAEDDDDDLLG